MPVPLLQVAGHRRHLRHVIPYHRLTMRPGWMGYRRGRGDGVGIRAGNRSEDGERSRTSDTQWQLARERRQTRPPSVPQRVLVDSASHRRSSPVHSTRSCDCTQLEAVVATESQHPSPLPPALSPQSAVKSCLDLPAFPVSFCTERDMSRATGSVGYTVSRECTAPEDCCSEN